MFGMSFITAERKTTLESDLIAIKLQITAIDSAMTGPALSGTKSFSFDSASGRAAEVFNSPLEMIDARRRLAATRDRIQRELNGVSFIRTQVRL